MAKNHTKIIKHRLHNNFLYKRVSTQIECGHYFIFKFEFSFVLKPNGLHSCGAWKKKKNQSINIRENIFLPKGNAPASEWVLNRKNLRLCSSRFEVESAKTSPLDCITWKKQKPLGKNYVDKSAHIYHVWRANTPGVVHIQSCE